MAGKNRTELNTETDNDLVATLTLSNHRSYLKDDMIESAVLRKDVIASETPAGGTVTIDFSNKDLATVTITANLAVSFSGMDNGDVKYLSITKNATNTLSFAGSTDVSIRKTYIDTIPTLVVYKVINKNGNIYVESQNIDNDIAAYSADLNRKSIDIGDWDMDATATPAGIAHGLTLGNIRNIQVIIRNDTGGTDIMQLLTNSDNSGVMQGNVLLGTVNVILTRLTGGTFDTTAYNATSYNRGWIIIDYIL